MANALKITLADGKQLAKKLQTLDKGTRTAVERTMSDFASRAPAWVKKGIKEHYGVDNAAIASAGPRVKRGDGNVLLVYSGKQLSLSHFKMRPKAPPTKRVKKPLTITSNGRTYKLRPLERYQVTAEIIKGRRTVFPARTFVTRVNGTVGAYERKSGVKRLPIQEVKTLSVPQMIDGRAKDTINQLLEENITKRFQNQINRLMK